MQVNVLTLADDALSWAAATCEGWSNLRPNAHRFNNQLVMSTQRGDCEYLVHLDFHRNWALSGPIVDREGIMFQSAGDDGIMAYFKATGTAGVTATGKDHLTAALRAYIIKRMGRTVELPEVFCEGA